MNQPVSRARWANIIAGALLGFVAGCSSLGGGSSNSIGEIHLFGLPTALTVPGSSLPGGVGVRIYASRMGGDRGLPIRQGRLEVLMFDQPATGLNPRTKTPLKIWSFQGAALVPFQSVTMMGTCYTLELRWDQDRPKGNLFTVVARYIGHGKTEIYSAPAVIAVTTH